MRQAADSDTLQIRPGRETKARMAYAASRLGLSLTAYLVDLFERRDGKLLPRRRLEVDSEDGRTQRKAKVRR